MYKLAKISVFSIILISNYAFSKTEYTGDIVDGVKVIKKLDVNDLEANKSYRFMFEGATMKSGQHWYVPVVVIKGANDGKKLLLNTGIHGDELNGSRVVQRLFAEINPKDLSGTMIGVLNAGSQSIASFSRNWTINYNESVNLNRVFPGKENGDAPSNHAYRLWNNLYAGNVDVALDLHTQSTGTAYPFFIYADYRNPEIKKLAEMYPADQIKEDEGEKGSVETTFVENNIPAVTLELGQPRIYQEDMINRAIEGTKNVMISYKMIDSKMGRTAKDIGTYIGNEWTASRAMEGGYSEILVKLGDDVKKGDKVAIQRNAFGDVIHEYFAGMDGKVVTVATDVLSGHRNTLVRVLGRK